MNTLRHLLTNTSTQTTEIQHFLTLMPIPAPKNEAEVIKLIQQAFEWQRQGERNSVAAADRALCTYFSSGKLLTVARLCPLASWKIKAQTAIEGYFLKRFIDHHYDHAVQLFALPLLQTQVKLLDIVQQTGIINTPPIQFSTAEPDSSHLNDDHSLFQEKRLRKLIPKASVDDQRRFTEIVSNLLVSGDPTRTLNEAHLNPSELLQVFHRIGLREEPITGLIFQRLCILANQGRFNKRITAFLFELSRREPQLRAMLGQGEDCTILTICDRESGLLEELPASQFLLRQSSDYFATLLEQGHDVDLRSSSLHDAVFKEFYVWVMEQRIPTTRSHNPESYVQRLRALSSLMSQQAFKTLQKELLTSVCQDSLPHLVKASLDLKIPHLLHVCLVYINTEYSKALKIDLLPNGCLEIKPLKSVLPAELKPVLTLLLPKCEKALFFNMRFSWFRFLEPYAVERAQHISNMVHQHYAYLRKIVIAFETLPGRVSRFFMKKIPSMNLLGLLADEGLYSCFREPPRPSNTLFQLLDKNRSSATSLHQLDLSKCSDLEDHDLARLVTLCPNLRELRLGTSPRLTKVGYDRLRELPALRTLHIVFPEHALHLGSLNHLHADGLFGTREDFKIILYLRSYLSDMSAPTPPFFSNLGPTIPIQVVCSLARRETNWYVLNFSSAIDHLTRWCPRVTSLTVKDDFILNAESSTHIAQRWGGLETLLLNDGDYPFDVLTALAHCTHLKKLKIACAYYLEDTHIQQLISNCQTLEVVELGRLSLLTDASLIRLATLARLRRLAIYGDRLITDLGINALLNRLDPLPPVELNLWGMGLGVTSPTLDRALHTMSAKTRAKIHPLIHKLTHLSQLPAPNPNKQLRQVKDVLLGLLIDHNPLLLVDEQDPFLAMDPLVLNMVHLITFIRERLHLVRMPQSRNTLRLSHLRTAARTYSTLYPSKVTLPQLARFGIGEIEKVRDPVTWDTRDSFLICHALIAVARTYGERLKIKQSLYKAHPYLNNEKIQQLLSTLERNFTSYAQEQHEELRLLGSGLASQSRRVPNSIIEIFSQPRWRDTLSEFLNELQSTATKERWNDQQKGAAALAGLIIGLETVTPHIFSQALPIPPLPDNHPDASIQGDEKEHKREI